MIAIQNGMTIGGLAFDSKCI